MTPLLQRLDRFAALADKPGDAPEARHRHRFLLITGVSMSFGGLIWGSIAFKAGLYSLGLIPFGYAATTVVNFFVLWKTKAFAPARTIQVFISLLLPFVFQWGLGGFNPSGAMMIWSMLALVCALSFESVRASLVWLFVYLALVMVSGFIDPYLVPPPIIAKGGLGPFSFPINIGTVSATVFGLTVYFLRLRDQANAALARTNAELAASHQALVQSEKMAALGQLVAGVAHELNTPLGAISASSGNMRDAVDQTLRTLPETLTLSTAEELALLRRLLDAGAVPRPSLTSREERKQREEIEARLEALGVVNGRKLARLLVQLVVADGVDAYLPLLRSGQAAALLEGAANLASLKRNNGTIETAVGRASKIVFALKSYAHPGSAEGGLIEASLADNLETVVTLYYNQIKQGVELVRRFDSKGVLFARHEELNQVWTNLIHNALQALKYKGRLEIVVREAGANVIVEIIDSGPGIPPEVQDRMFEPFYTTKEQGEGSGLGLSISKDIIQKHGGRIDVTTRPGHTCFTVSLPVKPVSEPPRPAAPTA